MGSKRDIPSKQFLYIYDRNSDITIIGDCNMCNMIVILTKAAFINFCLDSLNDHLAVGIK